MSEENIKNITIQDKMIKIIISLKKSKLIFKRILEKTDIQPSCTIEQEEKHTVIGIQKLERLQKIEKLFFEIRKLVLNICKIL